MIQLTLLLLLLAACSSPLTPHGEMVRLITLRGEKREIKGIQNTLRRDGCKMRQRIRVKFPKDAKNPEKALGYELKNQAAAAGGNGIMSTMQPQGDPPFVVGLVYICPEGKGILEDL